MRRLVAAIVPLILAITPALAIACDARCLGERAGQGVTGSGGHTHTSAHAGHTNAPHSSDSGAAVHVTAALTGEAPLHHGCLAAFDKGTLDRQPVTDGLAQAPLGSLFSAPAQPAVPSAGRSPHAPPASRPGGDSIPLRI